MLVSSLYANLFYGMGREEGVRKPNDFDKLSHKSLHFYPMWFLEWHSVLNLRTFQNKPFCSVLLEKLCLKHRKKHRVMRNLNFKGKKNQQPPSALPFFPAPICERQLNCRNFLLWLEQTLKIVCYH